ncbi:MAG: FG-GAP-like repeat-containing protein, partial [Planctomycetota bacterium]
IATAALLAAAASLAAGQARANVTDVTAAAGLTHAQGPPVSGGFTNELFGMTGGAAAGDVNGDGHVDLFFTRIDNTDVLYLGDGAGAFTDASATAFPAPINAATNGAGFFDLENDGDLDLYVTTIGETGHQLWVNDGSGVFTEQGVALGASIPSGDGTTTAGTSVSFGDYDGNGYVDAYVAEWRFPGTGTPRFGTLLQNTGGQFVDATAAAGVSMDDGNGLSWSFVPEWGDFDGDNDLDLHVASDFGTSKHFWNDGDGTFTEDLTGTLGTGTNDMGVASGDLDGDGNLDLFVTSIYFDGAADAHPNGNRLYMGTGSASMPDETSASGTRNGDWGWGAEAFDFDHDGDLDLGMTNGFIDGDQFTSDPSRLFENDGTGAFTDVAAAEGLVESGQGHGFLTVDIDDDGDLDVLITRTGDAPMLLENDAADQGLDWLMLDLEGVASNKQGIGAKIILTPDLTAPGDTMLREVSGSPSFLSVTEAVAHFGLEGLTGDGVVDQIDILWPSGLTQTLTDVPVNQRLTILETSAAVLPGDANGDGVVDLLDFDILAQNFGAPGNGLGTPNGSADGDFNGDGVIDLLDFDILAQNFGASSPANTSGAIPEPMSLALLGLAAPACLLRRRRG